MNFLKSNFEEKKLFLKKKSIFEINSSFLAYVTPGVLKGSLKKCQLLRFIRRALLYRYVISYHSKPNVQTLAPKFINILRITPFQLKLDTKKKMPLRNSQVKQTIQPIAIL